MNGRRGCGVAKAAGWRVFGVVAVAVVLLCGTPLSGATYEVYTGISAEMKHECTEPCPGPATRTTIGIREMVRCEIINFVDQDKEITSAGEEIVNDRMGIVYWYTEVGGSVYPLQGPSTVFTAPYSVGGTTCCVQAAVHDSHEKADDPHIVVQTCFNVVVPTGVTPTFKEDSALGVKGPPKNKVGARTIFYSQILPATVSFRWVSFRENITYQWEWFPDGVTKNELERRIKPFQVFATTVGGTLIPNVQEDLCNSGLYPISVLDDGTGYQPASYEWDVRLEFNNGSGWTQFCVEVHTEDYDGGDQSCQVGVRGTGSDYGTWQGPWQ